VLNYIAPLRSVIAALSVPMTVIEIKNNLPTHYLDSSAGRLAYDDTGGTGPLVIAVPGMGDLRGEHSYLTPVLAVDRNYRWF
jgi:hypothetical protein